MSQTEYSILFLIALTIVDAVAIVFTAVKWAEPEKKEAEDCEPVREERV